MDITTALASNYYTIAVSYERTSQNPLIPVRGEKFYTYKVPSNIPLQVGDAVIACPPQGYKVVIVTEVHETPNATQEGINYKWIVNKVDDESFKARQKNETTLKSIIALKEHQRKVDEYIKNLGLTQAELEQLKALTDV